MLELASASATMARAWRLSSEVSASELGEHPVAAGKDQSLSAAVNQNHLLRPAVEPTPGEKVANQVQLEVA